jgi:hypothetical protein
VEAEAGIFALPGGRGGAAYYKKPEAEAEAEPAIYKCWRQRRSRVTPKFRLQGSLDFLKNSIKTLFFFF